MKISGAIFREPLSGPNKGMLSIKVPQTFRSAYVTVAEIAAFEKNAAGPVQCGSEVRPANADFGFLQRALGLVPEE
jgi:hypothetical protein